MDKIYHLLNDSEIKECQIKQYKKGEAIFFEGERCAYIGILIKGELRIVSFLEDGSEVTYNTIIPGMMFGNNLIFSDEPIYRGDVISDQNSKVILIKKEILIKILQTNKEFLIAYLNQQSNFGKDLNLKIKLLTFKNAVDRINYYFVINYNKIEYKSISDLARRLYLTREVLSRTLHQMEKDEKIIIRAKSIVKI